METKRPKQDGAGGAFPTGPSETTGLAGAEAYLEAIYVLTIEDRHVLAARIAEYLGVTAVSVSRALTRLEKSGDLATRAPEVRLTPAGWQHAEAVVRRHRLAERWLADRLGLSLVEAHREAERLEHALSQRVEVALWEDLGRPATCPHGNPIPGLGEGDPVVQPAHPLSQVEAGRYVVDRIFEQLEGLESFLIWIEEQGLVPGAEVVVHGVPDDHGARSVAVAGPAKPLDVLVENAVARRILVRPQ